MNIWLKSLTLSILSNFILEISKNKTPKVLSSLDRVRKAVSNCCQDAMDPAVKLKKHVEAFPTKVYGKNLKTTYSCYTSIDLRESIDCFI